MRVTMKDIAKLVGVSQQTVSAVLRENKTGSRSSKTTRDKILRLATELNYIPNQAAISLKGGATQTIGIMGSLYGSAVNAGLTREISEIFLTHGYQSISCNYNSVSFNYTKTLTELISMGVDGVVIVNSDKREELLLNLSVPHLFLSHNNEGGYDVGVDDFVGGKMATEHLIKHGRRRIAYIGINTSIVTERQRGWEQALIKAKLFYGNSLILDLRDDDSHSESLLEKLVDLKVDAVFTQNDYIATKLMAILIKHGLIVPDDIAIIGYDGCSFAEFSPVPLTTVIQPVHRQAKIGAELLLERIKKKKLDYPLANIRIEPKLFVASSCGCNKDTLDYTFSINTFPLLEEHFKINFGKNINLENI